MRLDLFRYFIVPLHKLTHMLFEMVDLLQTSVEKLLVLSLLLEVKIFFLTILLQKTDYLGQTDHL